MTVIFNSLVVRLATSQMAMKISEDGCRWFLPNADTYLPTYVMLHPRRSYTSLVTCMQTFLSLQVQGE
jgi:hypothetical protein